MYMYFNLYMYIVIITICGSLDALKISLER